MPVTIFGIFLTIIGIKTPPDGKGCRIYTEEENAYYATGASCVEITNIIYEQWEEKNEKAKN